MRLSKTKDITAVLKRGRTLPSRYFLIRYLPNILSHHRVTVVAGLKISKKATVRNRLKRQIREILKQELLAVNFKNYDIMILCQPDSLNQPYLKLVNFMADCLKPLKVMK